ncbi:toll/interleukin-1 receptor domain-containing protein [Micromonospora peucetia]|uniref:TIR domain-containing protein n=1 Tax=Micromonospora peucetia TaxID=47871 RepID=A0A1C6UZQ8_9ACTN|nr:toll/interleukin-1 receptor domain-containing protein [Micromonospora peucetia]WSA35088.1 toll/interleukin-1 receptor domain-containing protein [Micromonospora peucetia]SCL59334.1 TIR domain-containing protein [Micromonospora peucetia]
MKVFISWSGEPSRSIASALHGWLGVVVQHVRPWLSDAEIESGTRWNDTLATNLESADFGLVCVTRSNQSAPWLMFESGALAKRLKVARVVPLCIDLEPAEIISPLQSFQSRKLDKEGMRRLVHELREMSDAPKPREDIDRLFEAMWPGLEEQVRLATTQHKRVEGPRRSPDDMLAELVTRVRSLEREGDSAGVLPRHDLRLLYRTAKTLEESVDRLSGLMGTVELLSHTAGRLEHLRNEESELLANSEKDRDRVTASRRLDAELALDVGNRVRHPDFGTGRVVSVEGEGKDQQARILFDNGHQMWVVIRFASLMKLRLDSAIDPSPSQN